VFLLAFERVEVSGGNDLADFLVEGMAYAGKIGERFPCIDPCSHRLCQVLQELGGTTVSVDAERVLAFHFQ